MTVLTGQVVAAFSRRFIVETAEGKLPCQVKGRHLRVVCGDQVEVRRDGDAGVIEAVLPRASLLILNKADLPETPDARERLNLLTRIGYPLVMLSALTDVAPLRPALHGHTTLLIGQSGMGKSTLINALFPGADVVTAEYSEALDSGRHTTTHTRLHRLDADSAVIDSPGLQEFALQHLDAGALAHAFVEFRPFLGQCRFRDCMHETEPGCRLQEAAAAGEIDPARLKLFQTLRRLQQNAAQRL